MAEDYKLYRHQNNPKEEEFYNKFSEKSDLTISLIVTGSRDGQTPVKFLDEEEIRIAKGTIQWLGSPVGQGFLSECGFELKKKE